MALKKKVSKTPLAEQARDNTTVTRGTRSQQETIKRGLPNDHSPKRLNGAPVVGVSIGSTLNMENYESLRVDVWLSDVVAEGETFEQAYQRVTKTVEDTLQEIVGQYISE